MISDPLQNALDDARWLLQSPLLYAADERLPVVGSTVREFVTAKLVAALDAGATFEVATNNKPIHRSGWWAELVWGRCLALAYGDRLRLRQQVIVDRVTHGEFDALLAPLADQDPAGLSSGQHWQSWELTVKQFRWLGVGDSADPTTWLGPNGREHVHIKWQHLREKQLALVGRSEVQQWLQDKGVQGLVQAAAWPCGRLFLPYAFYDASASDEDTDASGFRALAHFSFPDCVHPAFATSVNASNLSVGWWIHCRNLRTFEPIRRSHRFVIVTKTSLFAPRSLPGDTTAALFTWSEICQQASGFPIQGAEVAELQPNDQGWQEVRRLWIVVETASAK